MSGRIRTKHRTVAFTNANIADPTFRTFFVPQPHRVGELAQEMNYDGVEWHPMFDLTFGSVRAVVAAVRSGQLPLTSQHASFRGTRRSRDVNVGSEIAADRGLVERAMASPLGRLILPEVVNSSRFMRRVQAKVPYDLPAVLYPQADFTLDMKARQDLHGRQQRLFQPTDHVARMVGARTAEELVQKTIFSGWYDGFVLDTFHMQRRYGRDVPGVVSDLQHSLPWLRPYAFAGHVSLNRTDCVQYEPHLQKSTQQDLMNALEGKYEGATGEILSVLNDSPAAYMVVESPAKQISAATGHLTQAALTEDYRHIAGGLHAYFGN